MADFVVPSCAWCGEQFYRLCSECGVTEQPVSPIDILSATSFRCARCGQVNDLIQETTITVRKRPES